ncbi:MAG: formylglycine-generating enzyme family protein [Planctomycetes bacterium]|nr:formylglycine-generating enzyme family protein [Planctomycetota bacterium]
MRNLEARAPCFAAGARRRPALLGVGLAVAVVLATSLGLPAAGDPPAVPGFELLGKNAAGLAEYRHLGTGLVFVRLEGGSFEMGSPLGELGRFATEDPVHTVAVRPFLLSKTELTAGAWERIMGTRPWWGQNYSRVGDTFPATHISWNDCRAFAEKTGLRLPTEAEWEYACRAGSRAAYCFGSDVAQLGEYAWYEDNTWNRGVRAIQAVGGRKANAYGLKDMHGNVSEWCEDTWHADYVGAPADGRAWVDVDLDPRRVYRGGSWVFEAGTVRSAVRMCAAATFQTDHLGFRPAASLPAAGEGAGR